MCLQLGLSWSFLLREDRECYRFFMLHIHMHTYQRETGKIWGIMGWSVADQPSVLTKINASLHITQLSISHNHPPFAISYWLAVGHRNTLQDSALTHVASVALRGTWKHLSCSRGVYLVSFVIFAKQLWTRKPISYCFTRQVAWKYVWQWTAWSNEGLYKICVTVEWQWEVDYSKNEAPNEGGQEL